MMIRPALVDHLLDPEAFPLQVADDPRIKRRAFRELADGGKELLAQHLLPGLHILRRLQERNRPATCVKEPLAFAAQVLVEHLLRRNSFRVLENSQVVLGQ
jgi:hypothetical protein